MINKKSILILACVFIMIIFSSSVIASEDINTGDNSDISLNNQNKSYLSISHSYVVDGSSTNQMNNPTIQNAINKASSGDTIEITGTSYEHCHFVVNKNLTIISNVGTTMTTCPSNTDGSNGIGIFYISPEASGTVLSGFTFINDKSKSGSIDTYAIYINGASNVKVINCTIEKVSEGPGIYLSNAENTEIRDSTIKESQKGIYLENCNNINIKNNSINSNNVAGVYVGANCENINMAFNNIYSNNYYGIYLGSANNTLIYSNKIYYNRDNPIAQRAEKGTGIYVDTTASNLQIKGNLIQQNGRYGIYDSPKFTNMANQYVQIVDGNFFIQHDERGIYHADENGQTTIVYVWSNYYSNELFCGGTSYAPDILVGAEHPRDLIMSEITEIEKGVYSVSFIRKDTGEVASSLNSIEITFFLNKNDTLPFPSSGDIYRICPVVNGTAIADFRDAIFLETDNAITAVGPGIGIITYSNSGSRPSQKLLVGDSNIPQSVFNTTISGNSLNKYYGNADKYEVTLMANGEPLANKNVNIKINKKTYKATTNSQGIAQIDIDLASNTYGVELIFDGDGNYQPSSNTDSITIKPTITGNDVVKYHLNGTHYTVQIFDSAGNVASNTAVSFSIVGASYILKTDSNGIATLPINLKPGDYAITAYNTITYESCKNTIKVLPLTVTLSASPITMNYKDGTQYSVKVSDSKGNPITGQKVSLYINGKSFNNLKYDRTTNNNGIATLPINLNPGEYTITAVYGNEKITNGITVLTPVRDPIESKDIKMVENDRIPFTVKLLDENKNPIASEPVTFKIVGATYTKTSDENGVASLPINLAVGKYSISTKYNKYTVSNNIEVVKATSKIDTQVIVNNLNGDSGEDLTYTIILKNNNNKLLSGQNVDVEIDGKNYTLKTNVNGEVRLPLNLKTGIYSATVKYHGNSIYNPSDASSKITISSVKVVKETSNDELQAIIDACEDNAILKLTADNYENVSIIVNKPITLTTDSSILKGAKNKDVISLLVDGAIINGFEIIANNGNAINLNGNDNIISNCDIKSTFNLDSIDNHDSEKVKMVGSGIAVNSGENNTIKDSTITAFGNGIYLENADNTVIQNNIIAKNNYGIEFGENVSNTLIENNEINENIGLITLDVVEGPLGYGISLRESGVNVTIIGNEINSNYMGIFVDAQNCTGIKIVGNSISDSIIEGLTFNRNYTYAEGSPAVIVENNAIYNNAKGPSMIILGEISANPAGIYGPGEWDDTKKLYLGANWYGTNKYTTWGNITGPGTICPRISTTLITFNLSCTEPGKYNISFYNNGSLATSLPDFKVYFTLNFYTDKQIETIASVHEGVSTIEFPAGNYYETNNIIEASSGSLFDGDRQYSVIDTYNVPDNEIKK